MAFGKQKSVSPPKNGESILKPTMIISGDIIMNGPLYLDCKVDGSVTGKNGNSKLVIGPQAQVEGDVTAASIEVYGTIIGNIDCRSITIHSKAQIKGNIFYQIIEMQPESKVEGEIHNRSNNLSTPQNAKSNS